MTASSEAVVVGIGQAMAGDDAVGLVVARELARRGMTVRESTDASVLLSLLEEGRRVVLIDAVVGGGEPGDVLRLECGSLASGPMPLSSHGVGVAQAIELARVLYGDASVSGVSIVGVVIERPEGLGGMLSPRVASAVSRAADLASSLARATMSDEGVTDA